MNKRLVILLAAMALAAQAWGGERTAIITKVAGKAEILRAGEWNEAAVGDILIPGEAVRVTGAGEVSVETSDGKVGVSGKGGSVIEYDGAVDADIVPWKSARMARAPGGRPDGTVDATQQFSCPTGEVEIRVRTGEPLRVVTPLLTAAVRGTRFTMRVEADGSSSLRLREGAVDGYDRTGAFRRIAPGDGMDLASSDFVRYLGARGVELAPGQDWRSLPSKVLDSIDSATFSDRFSQVYYNPVVGQVVKSEPGREGVDESKVAKAAYIGSATLEEVLANPDANPFTPEWMDELAANPMTDAEKDSLVSAYPPGMGNSIANSVPGGDSAIGNGFAGGAQNPGDSGLASNGGPGSSLISDGLPNNELAGLPGNDSSGIPDLPSSSGGGSGMARVSGSLQAGSLSSNVHGSFGFNLDLNSGNITEGRISGNGQNNLNQQFGFGMSGGTGNYAGNAFSVGGFSSGQVNNNAIGAGTSFSGTAPSGLNERGNPVGGTFTVVDGGAMTSLTGDITGKRVN